MDFPFGGCPSVGNLVPWDPVLLSSGESIRLDFFFFFGLKNRYNERFVYVNMLLLHRTISQ